MKLHLRLIALFCALLLLASAWGCSMPGIGDESAETRTDTLAETYLPEPDTEPAIIEDTTEAETAADTPAGTEEMTVPLGTEHIPETTASQPETTYPQSLPLLNFHGETIKILYQSDLGRNEFDSDLSGEIIDNSIYARNIKIAELLNIQFEWTGQSADGSNASSFSDYAVVMAGAGEPFDIYCVSRRAMAELLTIGMLRDINKIEKLHIDLSAPYYPPLLQEYCSVGDSVFFVTGDISANALLQMQCVYYNVGLAEALGFKELTNNVKDGIWTLDALIEMSKGLYSDNDRSETPSPADSFGFCAGYTNLDAFYTGSALRFLEPDTSGEGLLMLSENINSPKAIDLADKLCSFLNSPDAFVSTAASNMDFVSPFSQESALFCQNVLGMADSYDSRSLHFTGFEYGILPIPKYDTAQEIYLTPLSDRAVLWAVAWSSVKDEACGAVIEAMAYEGHTLISPAVFENVMRIRYSLDAVSASEQQEMYDLIRAGICTDLGTIFSKQLQDIPSLFGDSVTSPTPTWDQTLSRFMHMLETKLIENINRRLEATIKEQ